MPIPQMRLVAMARKHGAHLAGATAMHGWARFKSNTDADVFAQLMCTQQWAVMMYQQGDIVAVDWTCERMANGHVTPIRSEYHHVQ